MERRSEARTEFGPWLEHLAWNAAALAAVAVMLLVLLGSLEWLDTVGSPRSTAKTVAKARSVRAAEACAPEPRGSG